MVVVYTIAYPMSFPNGQALLFLIMAWFFQSNLRIAKLKSAFMTFRVALLRN